MRRRPQVQDIQDTRALTPAARPVDQFFQVGGGGVGGTEFLSLAPLIPALNDFLTAERQATDERELAKARDAVRLRDENQEAFRKAVARGEIEETDNPYFVIAEIEAGTRNYLNRLEQGVRNGLRSEHAKAATIDPVTGRPTASRGLDEIVAEVDSVLRKDGGGSLNTFYAQQVINESRPEIMGRLEAFDSTQREEIRRQRTREEAHLAGVTQIKNALAAGPLDSTRLTELRDYFQKNVVLQGIEKPAEFIEAVVTSTVQQIAKDQGYDEARDALADLENLQVSKGRLIDRPQIASALRATRIQLEQDERAALRRAQEDNINRNQDSEDWFFETTINVGGEEIPLDDALLESADPQATLRQIRAMIPRDLNAAQILAQAQRTISAGEAVAGRSNTEMEALDVAFIEGDLETLEQAFRAGGFNQSQRQILKQNISTLRQNPPLAQAATAPLSAEARRDLKRLASDPLFNSIQGGSRDSQALLRQALADASQAASEAPQGQQASAYQKTLQAAQIQVEERLNKIRQSREQVFERLRNFESEGDISGALEFVDRNSTLAEEEKIRITDRLTKTPTFYQKSGIPQIMEGRVKGDLFRIMGAMSRESLGLDALAPEATFEAVADARRVEMAVEIEGRLKERAEALRDQNLTPNQMREELGRFANSILVEERTKLGPVNPETIRAAEASHGRKAPKRIQQLAEAREIHANMRRETLADGFSPANRIERAQMDLLRLAQRDQVTEQSLTEEANEVNFEWATAYEDMEGQSETIKAQTFRLLAADAGVNPDNILQGKMSFGKLRDINSARQNIDKDVARLNSLLSGDGKTRAFFGGIKDSNGLVRVNWSEDRVRSYMNQIRRSDEEIREALGLVKKNLSLRASLKREAPSIGEAGIRELFTERHLTNLKFFRTPAQIDAYVSDAEKNPENPKLLRYLKLIYPGYSPEGPVLEDPWVQEWLETEREKISYKRIQ